MAAVALRIVDWYGIISAEVPVAQWIEHRSPECAIVLTLTLLDLFSTTGTKVVKAQPYLEGKPEGETSMAVKSTVRG